MMKQKAGLGKKVSSIFDGVPLPNIVRPTEQAPPAYRPADIASQPRPMQMAQPMPPRTAAIAAPQAPRTMPAMPPQSRIPVQMPQTRHTSSSSSGIAVSGESWQQLIHKIFFSGNSETDARNKKTVAMMGILSVVLVVVVWQTGIFSGQSSQTAPSTIANANAGSGVRIDWTPPEPYPVNFRDPMQVGSTGGGGGGSVSGPGGFVVKSIVYVPNDTKSSTALINGEILREGKSIGGATIIKINKDSVEFSANGKSWKQQVE
jgi:hypothetical protein